MRKTARKPEEDLFVIPVGEDRYYLYAPLRCSLAVINGASAKAVATYLEGGERSLNPAEASVIGTLKERGVIGGEIPDPPTFPDDYRFLPYEVTLFPTSRCNLRCRYCYADAGRKSVEMSWEIARAAIDLVSTNAGLLGSEIFSVGFHGGGEPTVAWSFIQQCVDHAHRRAGEKGLEARIFSATNGLLSTEQREYIAQNFESLTISLDGPEDLQDRNRPKIDGSGSHREVCQTLRHFDRLGFPYVVRSTITASTVHRMQEIVKWIGSQFKVTNLHMEPAWQCGRCITTGEIPPEDLDFIDNFRLAAEEGRRLGVNVYYSGARLDVLTSKFCGAAGDSFTVLPEGIATSCYEITETSDPRAAIFHYGHFNPQSRSFWFDHQRIDALQRLSVEYIDYCRDCFCKWHCAGDCLAKVFGSSGKAIHHGSLRCSLNRALTLTHLDQLLEASQRPVVGPDQGGSL